ncbi:hypothetical protein BV22DRAFT_815892 [Leucogyrophana mollusca]|uniref:Uncharacterized protein n=1 Tax=Leucogyrophana mollusca TaxID=85980 RepID=A0ACB8B4Q9_9AGAM|nr:hypothetical protein BV22DRAFT_815892 [Leucogyrophana mollusca]
MIFFNRKPKLSTLPTGWPSPFHNKCSQRDCIHANSPKVAKGVYPCKGVPGGFFCEGTYKISSTRARETERYLQEMARQAAEEEERKRRAVDLKRMEMDARRRGKESVDRVLAEERARSAQIPRTVRGLEIKRVPQHSPYSRPEVRGRRPSQVQIEQEYVSDQIMMQMYPDRRIQPRWI